MVRTPLIAADVNRIPPLADEWTVFQRLTGWRYPMLAASATTGESLETIGSWLFRELGIVRAHTKAPGNPPDMGRPFTVRRGQTVRDVARLMRHDLAQSLKYARHWTCGQPHGQRVGPDHPVAAGNILEMHV